MIDGIDGVGKTTQITQVSQHYANQGHPVYITRAHGGTEIGEKLRDVSLSHSPRNPYTDLFISRAIHAELASSLHERQIAGEMRFIDRSPASMLAYQVYGSGLPKKEALPVIQSDFEMFKPDILIIYTASLDVLKSRRASRATGNDDYFESQKDEYRLRVLNGYVEAAELFGGHLIDASADIDSVRMATIDHIDAMLAKHK